MDVFDQSPRLGGVYGDIGHCDWLIYLGGAPANEILADLLCQPNCLGIGEKKAVGGGECEEDVTVS